MENPPQTPRQNTISGLSNKIIEKINSKTPLLAVQLFLSGFSALAYQIISFKLIQAAGLGDALSIAISLTSFVSLSGVGAILATRVGSRISATAEILMGTYGVALFLILEVAGLSWYIALIHALSYPARIAALITLLSPLAILGGMLIPLAEKREKLRGFNRDTFIDFGKPYFLFHAGGAACLVMMELYIFGTYGWTTAGIAVSMIAILNGLIIAISSRTTHSKPSSNKYKSNNIANLSLILLVISIATGYGGIVSYKAFDYLVGPNIRNYTIITSSIFLALALSSWHVSRIDWSLRGVLGAAGLGLAIMTLPAGIFPSAITHTIQAGTSHWWVYAIASIGLIIPIYVLFGVSVPAIVKKGLPGGEALFVSSVGNAIGYWIYTTTAAYNVDAAVVIMMAISFSVFSTLKMKASIATALLATALLIYPNYYTATHHIYLSERSIAEELAINKALASTNSHIPGTPSVADVENATWDFSIEGSWATRGWTVDHTKITAKNQGHSLYETEFLNIGGYNSLGVSEGSGTTAYETLSAAIPAMYSNKDNAMVLGAGTGVGAEFLSRHYNNIDIVDISPDANSQVDHFKYLHGGDGLSKNMVLEEDAISYITSSDDNRYDLIFSTLSGSGYSFASMLYTKEFFDLAQKKLNDEGVFAFWVGGNFGVDKGIPSILKAMENTFDHVKRVKIDSGESGSSGIVYQALVASDKPLSVNGRGNGELLASLKTVLEEMGEMDHVLSEASSHSLDQTLSSLEDRNPLPETKGEKLARMKNLSFAYDHSPNWKSFARIMEYLASDFDDER